MNMLILHLQLINVYALILIFFLKKKYVYIYSYVKKYVDILNQV
jgi:hypothetical protein